VKGDGEMNNRTMTVKEATNDYFKRKAKKYDLVEEQAYWQLSDKILWTNFKRVLDKLPKNFEFIDAGGGTGRWSLKVLQEYPNAKGITYDLSHEMLTEAEEKRDKHELFDRWEIIQGDIHNVQDVQENRLDIAFNFHNVLGFVEYPIRVIKQLYKLLKPGGHLVSFVPNQYHSIYFNLANNRVNEARTATSGKGRFTQDMPYINVFTPQSIKEIYSVVGLEDMELLGFPAFIYPGYQETQLEGNTFELVDLLKDPSAFEEVFNIEMEFMDEQLAARGNNLYIVGIKK